MNNKKFIEKAFTDNTKKREHGSLLRDDTNNVYSYGVHYPLLFKINGLVLINESGYSNSTSKHINLAREVARELGVNALGVNLYPEREGYSSGFTHIGRMLWYNDEERLNDEAIAEEIIGGLQHHLSDLGELMASKKRKNTQIYNSLVRQFDDVAQQIGELL